MRRCLIAALWLAIFTVPVVVVNRARTVPLPPKKPSSFTPERNPVNTTDKTVLLDFSVEEGKEWNVLWKAQHGTTGYASLSVAEGKVLLGTNNGTPRDPHIKGDKGIVQCFEARTGEFLWQIVHDKLGDSARDVPEQGVVSTPVVVQGKVYYVSNRCEVVCADLNGDGKGGPKILWTLDMIGKLGVFPCQLAISSPLVVDDLVYVITGNGVNVDDEKLSIPSPKAPSFLALDRHKGTVVWQDNSPGDKIIEGQWSSPTYATVKGKGQVIFGGGDGYLYSFEPKTGKLLWKFNTSVKEVGRKGDKEPRNYPLATPVVVNHLLYLGIGANPDHANRVGHFWCIDISKEPKNEAKDLSPAEGNSDPRSPANKDSALVWHYGGKINPKPVRGRDTIFGPTLSLACVVDGLVYAAETNGYLHCLDARTGACYWVDDFQTGTWATPYGVAGKILLGNDDGDILVYEHGRKLKPPQKINVIQPVRTRPTVVDGILYLATETDVYAIGKK